MPLLSSWGLKLVCAPLCFGQKSFSAPSSHSCVTLVDIFQPFSNLTTVHVHSKLSLEPTGAGIWGIKSVPEDFHLVQRLSKKITVLYFGNMRKASNSWALLPCVTAVSFGLPSRARVCLQGSFWTVPGQSWLGDAVPS